MSRKTIPIQKIKNGDGKIRKVPSYDDDGEMKISEIIEACDSCGSPKAQKPELKEANTLDVIRQLIWSIPEGIRKNADGYSVPRINNAIVNAEESIKNNGHSDAVHKLQIRETDYEWMTRLMDRKIPLNKEAKEAGYSESTYAMATLGLNWDYILWQIKDVDDRGEKDYFDIDDDESDDTEE